MHALHPRTLNTLWAPSKRRALIQKNDGVTIPLSHWPKVINEIAEWKMQSAKCSSKQDRQCGKMLCDMLVSGFQIQMLHIIIQYGQVMGSCYLKPILARQEGKHPMIKVLQGCILKLSLHSVNLVLIFYRPSKTPSAILLSFVASSSLPEWPDFFFLNPYFLNFFQDCVRIYADFIWIFLPFDRPLFSVLLLL